MSQVFSGKSITVLMGGNSAERAISLGSGGAVADALASAGGCDASRHRRHWLASRSSA